MKSVSNKMQEADLSCVFTSFPPFLQALLQIPPANPSFSISVETQRSQEEAGERGPPQDVCRARCQLNRMGRLTKERRDRSRLRALLYYFS